MRKRIGQPSPVPPAEAPVPWIDLEPLTAIEVTSEDPEHPIECALVPGFGDEWKASQAGPQRLRVLFDHAQDLHDVRLVFAEHAKARTQEFVLRWSRGEGDGLHDVVRQQYNFQPGSIETEEYQVALGGVKVLELEITPSINRDVPVIASLAEMRLR
jgi:hypothetical protein